MTLGNDLETYILVTNFLRVLLLNSNKDHILAKQRFLDIINSGLLTPVTPSPVVAGLSFERRYFFALHGRDFGGF